MKALIFGASGQDGFYLSHLLQQQQVEVVAASRTGENGVRADVADYAAVSRLIADCHPDYIFHLAANSTTSHDALFENHAAISLGTLNVLEATRLLMPSAKVFISGSGLQFRNTGMPIKETDTFEARDPYSVSRIESVYASRYFRTLGLKVYVGYFFNHDSPRRTPRHLAKMIASTVADIANGADRRLQIGNLSVQKEWGYAGDIVEAVWTLVQQNEVFEAVLGTGKAYSVQQYIETCFSLIGRDWTEFVDARPGFKAEYQVLVSDPRTIFSLGWHPHVDIHQLAQMMLTE